MTYVVLRPHITEKSMQNASLGWYTFQVENAARKEAIKKLIEGQFKVHVVEIKTVHIKGKDKRAGKKRLLSPGKDYKKAVVRLKSGEKIDLFAVEAKNK